MSEHRLIDANNLIEYVWRERLDTRERIAHLVESMPTIEERKTGAWKPISDGYVDIYECDQCGETEDYVRDYCPNCGSYNGGKV